MLLSRRSGHLRRSSGRAPAGRYSGFESGFAVCSNVNSVGAWSSDWMVGYYFEGYREKDTIHDTIFAGAHEVDEASVQKWSFSIVAMEALLDESWFEWKVNRSYKSVLYLRCFHSTNLNETNRNWR